MTNKKTQKDQLAKLMATENLTIVHKKVPTAYFDMKNRILCCPIFKEDLSSELYDLFMGHEVGHALNTPYEGVHSALTKNRTLKGYLNVVEDVRIEKAIKNKYPGLRKAFFTAYNELMEMDFFGIAKKDVNSLSLIDKINLITKVGSRVNITLSTEENGFLQMAEDCKTWEDVEECANAIYNWSKENETRDELDESIIPQTLQMEEDDMEQDEDGDFEENDDYGDDDGSDDEDNLPDNVSQDAGDPADEEDEDGETAGGDEGEEGDSPAEENRKPTGREGGDSRTWGDHDDSEGARESVTEHNAHNNEEQFISEDNTITTTVLLKDKFTEHENFKHIVVGYKKVNADFDKHWTTKNDYRTAEECAKELSKAQITSKKLRDKNKKVVSHMAKEFEMRQTAMRSAKAFQGKTGKLDMNRLAKYQIVDDIFKKVTYLPDGKNHGLQVMLDWSGSIHSECADLLEQAMVLVDFCRKVQIPHRIYLFTDSYQNESASNDDVDYWENRSTRLVELFSDKQSSKEFIKAHQCVSHLWNCHSFEGRGWKSFEKIVKQHNEWFGGYDEIDPYESSWYDMTDFREPNGYRLGGTPLDTCLTAMRTLVPAFNSEYGIEKSILTVITDGFSHGSKMFSQTDSEYEEKKEQESDEYGWRTPTKRVLIDPFTNKSYPYYDSQSRGHHSFDQTQNILDWISKETGVIVTGYFVLGRKQDLWNIYESLPSMDVDSTWRQIRKEGVAFEVKGYNKLFLTSTSALSVAGDSELDDELVGATKRKLLGAFKKNQNSKTTSRFLTNEFIKEIA